MTRPNSETDDSSTKSGEPVLAEIAALRRLLPLEVAAPEDKDRVYASARRELSARPAARAPFSIGRPWSIAILALGTSTALAATPPGRQLLQSVQALVTGSASEEIETKQAPPTRQEGRVSEAKATEPEGGTLLTPLPDLPVDGRQEAAGTRAEAPSNRTRQKLPAAAAEPAAATEAETKKLEAEERKLVEQARFALGQGRYADAWTLSEEHRRRFPRGKLGPERDAIERQVRAATEAEN
jgi:hypothetical protein